MKQGTGLRAFCLEDSSMTVHEILAAKHDVLVCSYEFVETSDRDLLKFGLQDGPRDTLPSRPGTVLFSTLWNELSIPFKRMILDEAQIVKKRSGIRHKTLLGIPAKAVIMLSGTFAHNKWHDISGYLDFIKGHPFDSHSKFIRFFFFEKNDSYQLT